MQWTITLNWAIEVLARSSTISCWSFWFYRGKDYSIGISMRQKYLTIYCGTFSWALLFGLPFKPRGMLFSVAIISVAWEGCFTPSCIWRIRTVDIMTSAAVLKNKQRFNNVWLRLKLFNILETTRSFNGFEVILLHPLPPFELHC